MNDLKLAMSGWWEFSMSMVSRASSLEQRSSSATFSPARKRPTSETTARAFQQLDEKTAMTILSYLPSSCLGTRSEVCVLGWHPRWTGVKPFRYNR